MADDEPSNWDKTAGDGLFGKGADPWDNTDDDAGADGRVHGLEDVDLVPGDDDGSVSTYGDNGAGLGASHQTGWTGVVARLMQYFALVDAPALLAKGNRQAFQTATR